MKKVQNNPQKKVGEDNLKKFFTSTQFLTLGMMSGTPIILLAGYLVGAIIFEDKTPELFVNLIAVIAIVPWMIGGLFIIIRREIPRPELGMKSITGWPAVISGIFIVAGTLIAEIYFLFKMLSRIR